MYTKELQVEIQVLARQGKGIREIARTVGCSRNLVRRVLRRGTKARYGPRPPRPRKLDPFAEYVRERIERAKPNRLAATVLLRELRELGYDGGSPSSRRWSPRSRRRRRPNPWCASKPNPAAKRRYYLTARA